MVTDASQPWLGSICCWYQFWFLWSWEIIKAAYKALEHGMGSFPGQKMKGTSNSPKTESASLELVHLLLSDPSSLHLQVLQSTSRSCEETFSSDHNWSIKGSIRIFRRKGHPHNFFVKNTKTSKQLNNCLTFCFRITLRYFSCWDSRPGVWISINLPLYSGLQRNSNTTDVMILIVPAWLRQFRFPDAMRFSKQPIIPLSWQQRQLAWATSPSASHRLD